MVCVGRAPQVMGHVGWAPQVMGHVRRAPQVTEYVRRAPQVMECVGRAPQVMECVGLRRKLCSDLWRAYLTMRCYKRCLRRPGLWSSLVWAGEGSA